MEVTSIKWSLSDTPQVLWIPAELSECCCNDKIFIIIHLLTQNGPEMEGF